MKKKKDTRLEKVDTLKSVEKKVFGIDKCKKQEEGELVIRKANILAITGIDSSKMVIPSLDVLLVNPGNSLSFIAM